MDGFAREYLDKIKKIAPDFYIRRKELSESRIKMAAACLCRQLLEFGEKYDLILGAGNSGLFMTKIAALTYDALKTTTPTIVNLPIYRYEEDKKNINDNDVLLDQSKELVKKIKTIGNVLFIDDEIMKGITAKICFELMLKIYPAVTHLETTIIAENHFFEWHYKIPQVSVRFFSYAPLIQGLNGNIGYFVPKEIYESLSEIFPRPFSYNHAMAVVIGGGIKQRDDRGNQFFNFNVGSQVEAKITNYRQTQSLLLEKLKDLVNEGVKKYRSGEIRFRF